MSDQSEMTPDDGEEEEEVVVVVGKGEEHTCCPVLIVCSARKAKVNCVLFGRYFSTIGSVSCNVSLVPEHRLQSSIVKDREGDGRW